VKENQSMEIKRILYPVDLSDFSTSIVPQVISLAEKFSAEIHIVAVVEPFDLSSALSPTADPLSCDTPERAEQKLQVFEHESFLGYRSVKRTLLCGRAAEEILNYITTAGIDIVVMATHRKTNLERALLGSVADEVIRKSHVPVMSINPEKGEPDWSVSNVSPGQEIRLRPDWRDIESERPS
jgi:nucleotide-binding universal stress UspA family protein